MSKILLRDIAEQERLSISQVSRALRGCPGVAPELRARIIARAQSLNYRNCSNHHSVKIALLGTSFNAFLDFDEAFYQELKRRNWDSFRIRCDNWKIVPNLMPDGIFFFGYNLLSGRIPDPLKNFPLVAINDYPSSLDMIASVFPDADSEAEAAIQHLLSLGHRHIVRLRSIDPVGEPNRWRQRGVDHYQEIASRNFSLDLRCENYSEDQMEVRVAELLAQGVTALIDINHFPLRLLRAIRACGKRIPEDVSVITYENPSISAYTDPPLTTVAFDFRGIAREAGLLMDENLRQKNSRSQVIPSHLILRGSTGPVPR